MAMCVEDRISSFPDHILCSILSFLPIKEAVRTSIISNKWRYLFASISTIVFDRFLLHGLTDRNVDSFKNFVNRLLKFPDQVSLDCFRLRGDGISSWNDGDHEFNVSGWICAALCRGVKEIDLRLDYLEDTLPALLFTCHSLLTLTLEAKCFQGSKIEVPSDFCLGNLKALYLTSLVLFGDSIHRLISNCHVLQDLAFIEFSVANASGLNIRSPSLKELLLLRLFSTDHVVVINAPNLRFRNYAVYF
ncbi:hypothetical protein Godav_012866 [Gossypium davidsonii]|uniref:F-box domain-containing protein n=1 Tax=Gossypium davidsonii TaxID=34287 RepID=A0A7J8RF74_GOSDV|nr:hypothetical protein [Gossypium davidsonii]